MYCRKMKAQYRIVTNTIVLYIKMLLSIFVTFYSTRIILNALGVNDFGIYNLVAGAISLLGFVNGSMSNTVQRFLAYELGHGALERLRKTFALSMSMHLIVGIGLIVVLELLGILAFEYFFVIEKESVLSAKIAYQIMIGVAFLGTISSPLSACIYAHEDIALFAVVEFISSILKLGSAFVLMEFSQNRLVFYCIFLLIIQLLLFIFQALFCWFRYEECHHVELFRLDRELKREVFPFLGWNMLESFSWLGKNQGISVLMNSFYGTVVNAAYGIGNQIQGQVMFFSTSLLNAIRPQIYKLGGAGDIAKMLSLSGVASKFAFFILLLLLCPLIFVLNKILYIWLGIVPEYTERICILLLIISLFNYMSIGINIAIQAYGNVKIYQIVASLIILLSIPISYLIYSFSNDVYLLLYIMVIVELISVVAKYYIAAQVFGYSIIYFIRSILLPCMAIFVISLFLSYFLAIFMLEDKLWVYILFIIADVCMVSVLVFWGGLSKSERHVIINLFKSIKAKLNNKIKFYGR